jgi:TonB family protein
MKAQLLMLGAAASLLAATTSRAATDRQVQDFVEHAQAQAQSSLDTCGVNLSGRPVAVSGYIDPQGRLKSVRVVSSTGSAAADETVALALRRLHLADVPPQLVEAKLTFFLRQNELAQAKAP